MKSLSYLAGLGLLSLPPFAFSQANSALFTYSQLMGNWNAIVHDDLLFNGSHSQSGLAVGDTATFTNASDINQNNVFGSPYALRIYGQLTLSGSETKSLNGGATVVRNNSVNVGLKDFALNGGAQRVLTFGSNANSLPRITFNGNNGAPPPASFLASTDDFFTSRHTSFSSVSQTFDLITGMVPVKNGNRLTFTAPANGNVSVFDWNVGTTGAISEVQLNVPANSFLVVNVFNAGNAWAPSFNFLGANPTMASRVLWNILDGTNLTTNRHWYGSILAPDSSLVMGENLDGQIFAEDLTFNSRELHFVKVSAIPEPSAFALLAGVGVLGVVGAKRSRKARSAAKSPVTV
ncbi:MAG: choice-of-anchor A family protein [Opitutaceae bacterium]|nr:choice-of-anchor A family protein [Opitutaceae bacterium]